MRIVCIGKCWIDEAWVVHGSHLVEVVIRPFGELDSLFLGIDEILGAFHRCFIEVEDTQVIEAAENVEMDFRFTELDLGVERIGPCDVKVFYYASILGIPIKMLSNKPSVSDVHLDQRYVFIYDFDVRLVGKFQCTCFIPQLIDRAKTIFHRQSRSRWISMFQILNQGLHDVGRLRFF